MTIVPLRALAQNKPDITAYSKLLVEDDQTGPDISALSKSPTLFVVIIASTTNPVPHPFSFHNTFYSPSVVSCLKVTMVRILDFHLALVADSGSVRKGSSIARSTYLLLSALVVRAQGVDLSCPSRPRYTP